MVAAPPRIVLSVALPERAPIEPSSSASAESTATAAAPERPATEAPGRSERELKAERLLLTTARTALSRQDFASARAAVERHAREFPHGQFSEEREVLRVQILKAAGDDSAASERAAAFKKSFPKSMQQDAVDQAAAPARKR
jgi:Tfp pilus assembly protein PilF